MNALEVRMEWVLLWIGSKLECVPYEQAEGLVGRETVREVSQPAPPEAIEMAKTDAKMKSSKWEGATVYLAGSNTLAFENEGKKFGRWVKWSKD